MNLYTAGPIDLGKDVPQWRSRLKDIMDSKGIAGVIFDPSTAYKPSLLGVADSDRGEYIESVNTTALELADAFVVCLPAGVQSVGTPIELDLACELDKPVALLTNIPRGKSLYLDNRVSEQEWFFCDLSMPGNIDIALTSIVDYLHPDILF
jgi:nucleoside 2-deoxyribosyltransferase